MLDQVLTALQDPTREDLRKLVCALGIAQIVSWGTLFYSIAVLAITSVWLVGAERSWVTVNEPFEVRPANAGNVKSTQTPR